MTAPLFQTIYCFAGLAIVLLLSAIWKAKRECTCRTCRVKVQTTIISLITAITISAMFGFTQLNYVILGFILLMGIGSALYPRVEYAGPAVYLAAFVGLFIGFQVTGIHNMLNIGTENVTMFGSLIAISIMYMRKHSEVITIYIVGLMVFFITGTMSGMLPLVIGSILIVLSETMKIYLGDVKNEISENLSLDLSYFSAGLYSYGILMLPLLLL